MTSRPSCLTCRADTAETEGTEPQPHELKAPGVSAQGGREAGRGRGKIEGSMRAMGRKESIQTPHLAPDWTFAQSSGHVWF